MSLIVGSTRSEAPDPEEVHAEELTRQLRQTQERAKAQARKIEQLRNQLSMKKKRIATLENSPAARNDAARKHVEQTYGYGAGLPVVDLLDLLPDLEETIEPYNFLREQGLPTDIALLKGLARMSPGCRYLEISSGRGESIANVAAVARECVSICVSEQDLKELGSMDDFVQQHEINFGDIENIRRITHNSQTFDFSDFEHYFDVVFIDGDRSRQGVKVDTENAFRLLRDDQSAIVWHDYGFTPGTINWEVFAGLLDGCPEDERGELYHVSNTLCAVRISRNKELPHRSERGYSLPSKTVAGHRILDKTFRVEIRARRNAPPAPVKERRLAIVDDVFPHVLSAFRVAEYNAYLERWQDAVVYTTAAGFRTLRETRSFEEILNEYAGDSPRFRDRIVKLDSEQNAARHFVGDELVYTVFLYNAFRLLDLVHALDLPYAFTLYPGGRFRLNQEESDNQLRAVCSSPNLRKVIATQKATYEYLLEKKFCTLDKIEFVYGGVFPSRRLSESDAAKKRYGKNKNTLDICFVAHKYTDRGVDKGYDVFVEVAKLLSKEHDDVFFHVVGSFDESDIDVDDIRDRIEFYGTRPTQFFPKFYSEMDVILSPNAPFVLSPGAFDGFPTGGCIEAGLSGVAVFCSDPLDQNVAFEDGEELVIVPRDPEAISESIVRYRARPDELGKLAARGQKAFRRVFGEEAQLEPRLRLLSELLGESSLGLQPGSRE